MAVQTGAGGSDAADWGVGVLSADLPATVGFARVLPANFSTKMAISALNRVPVFVVEKTPQTVIVEWTGDGGTSFVLTNSASGSADRAAFYSSLNVAGNSGSPPLLSINGQTVILGTLRTQNTGPAFAGLLATINAAMTTLGGSYQLTQIDLGGFLTV